MSGSASQSNIHPRLYAERRKGVTLCRTYVLFLDVRQRSDWSKDMVYRRVKLLGCSSTVIHPLLPVVPGLHCSCTELANQGIRQANWQLHIYNLKPLPSETLSKLAVLLPPVCVVVTWILNGSYTRVLFVVKTVWSNCWQIHKKLDVPFWSSLIFSFRFIYDTIN